MKSVINILFVTILSMCCVKAQKISSQSVQVYLKNNKFQLGLYELSFCAKEILPMLETDSISRKYFKLSLRQSFDSRIDKYNLFINYKQAQMLFDSLTVKNYQKQYPKAYQYVISLKKDISPIKVNFANYSDLFLGSIQYPDQVDDSCIFYLIFYKDEKPFDEILSDNDALYRYDQWLKFGFVEFRGYSSKKTVQNEISNRIISRIKINHSNPRNQLLVKTLKMLNEAQRLK